jgi:hypothetical protein
VVSVYDREPIILPGVVGSLMCMVHVAEQGGVGVSKKKGWIIAGGVLLGLVVVGAAFGEPEPAPAAAPLSPVPPAVAPVVPVPAPEPTGLQAGMYIVGTELEPGRYSMICGEWGGYVDQKDGDDYLAQEVGSDGARILVDIENVPGSIVTFSRVTDIQKIG